MWFKMKLVWCLMFLGINFSGFLDALKPGEDGVCVVKISVRKTRTKFVPTGKMCGKKRCTTKKVEHYTAPEQRIVCCNGWEYDVNSDSCGPVCSMGCIGGRCIAPDVCHCDPPATLDPEHKNSCLQPTCNPLCVNSTCNLNNTCTCYPDHTKFNSTHCLKCDNGYAIDKDFTCAPICEHECINGKCIAPNNCTCLEGYETNGNACVPKCDKCVNSTCEAPNYCSCNEGFKRLDNSTCVLPFCEDCAGDCIARNMCRCGVGYKNVDGVCKPLCVSCHNGNCTAPGECTCNEGFVNHGRVPSSCVKSCGHPFEAEKRGVPKTKFTKFPTSKKCPSGTSECSAKEIQNQRYPKGFKCCKKILNPEPVKNLFCCTGWELVGKICKAICRDGCNNGKCVSPEVCECERPLQLVNGNECIEPVCENSCHNALCVANNTCECNPGFKPYNDTHCATECEPGHIHDPVTLNCIPKCDSPCLNGTCTGPNICTCLVGYKSKDASTCVPECTPSCVNADCVAPNTCSCHKGYKDEDGHCVPVCDQPCKNGVCSAPNVCECDNGYKLDDTNNYDCLPICEPKCINASCVSPDTCSCLSGYDTTGSTWICQPKCDDCENGDCVAPSQCDCHEGYSKVDGKCKPACDGPCLNGFCSEPNVCTCDPGFRLNSKDKFICEPVCESSCVNATCTAPNICSCINGYEPTGVDSICKPSCTSCLHGECVAPNICDCHDGYNLTDGICSPVCAVPCINAKCTAPNKCTCFDGYEKLSFSVCHKPCLRCDNGVCSLQGICRCDRGYELINNTCAPILPVNCTSCEYNCSLGDCWCADDRPCMEQPEVATATTTLAGMELTWALGDAIVLLLSTLVIVVMHRIYRKRKELSKKNVDNCERYGNSVVYTVPNTLIQRQDPEEAETDDGDENNDVTKTDPLLMPGYDIKEQRL